jgi:hypothetical protein
VYYTVGGRIQTVPSPIIIYTVIACCLINTVVTLKVLSQHTPEITHGNNRIPVRTIGLGLSSHIQDLPMRSRITARFCKIWAFLTKFMELSPSREAASCVANQDLHRFIYEPQSPLPCPQEPFSGPFPKPGQSSPCHIILYLQDPF